MIKEEFLWDSKLRYFSWRDPDFGFEITLEPCFNGFDIGLYSPDGWLLRPKECTNEMGYGAYNFIEKEIKVGTQPRRPETWEKAVKIANRFYHSLKNYIRLRKLNLVEAKEGEVDYMLQKVKHKGKIHGLCPKGRF